MKDKQLFDEVYSKYPINHSDYCFTTLVSWMKYSNSRYHIFDGNIVLSTEIDGKIRFRPPLGKHKPTCLDEVLSLALEHGCEDPLGMIDEPTKEWIASLYPSLKFIEHRNFFDYVYKASDLASLSGSSYSKIRNRFNKFVKQYPYTIEEISSDIIDEVHTFLQRWCLWRDCESDVILSAEKDAILYSMAHFFELGLSGIILRINDEIEAMAVYEALNADTALVHYEKGSPFYDGVYKAINVETAKILENNFTYINREADMGISGLRKAKQSYHPHHMIKVFHVRKKDLETLSL
ncbi:MAG: phosphatidylglycerol lysyltransferase domain-containing protein [Thermoplasmatota archaeon]